MEKKLSAEQIIEFISQAKKVTPVKVYVKGTGVASLSYGTDSKVFGRCCPYNDEKRYQIEYSKVCECYTRNHYIPCTYYIWLISE